MNYACLGCCVPVFVVDVVIVVARVHERSMVDNCPLGYALMNWNHPESVVTIDVDYFFVTMD